MKRVKYSLTYTVQKTGGTRMLSGVTDFEEGPHNVNAL